MPSRKVNRKNKAGRGGKRDATRRQSDKRLVQLERELRANKARWQTVVANPFMGVTVLSRTGHFVTANSTFQAMVGYTEDELKKLTPLDITPAGDREANKILLRELQRGKRQHYELTKRLQRKDGEVVWVQLYVFGIPDHGAVGMTINATEKMRAENALQIAQAELGAFGACEPNGCHDRVDRARNQSAFGGHRSECQRRVALDGTNASRSCRGAREL